MIILI
jgi:HNH endonuclease